MAKRLLISGEVQGVYYRAWSVSDARRLGLRGWVRNRRNGKVEMLVDGAEEALNEMIALCRQGPPAAKVAEIEIEEVKEPAPAGFEKRPTV